MSTFDIVTTTPGDVIDPSELIHAVAQFKSPMAVLELRQSSAQVDLQYIEANLGHRILFSVTKENVGGHLVGDFVPPTFVAELTSRAVRCTQSQTPVEFDWHDVSSEHERWVRNLVWCASTGDLPRILWTSTALTSDQKREHDRQLHQERLRAVVDHAFDAILTVDRDQRIQFMNTAAEKMFGYTLDELIGKDLTVLLPPRFRKNHGSYAKSFDGSVVQSRDMRERSEVCGLRRNGDEFRAQVSISKLQLNGQTEMAAIIRDVSETARMITELTTRATTDFLTGIFNRLAFTEALTREYNRSKRYARPLTLAVIDVDHFKKINDAYGHSTGDAVLKQLAKTLHDALRSTDILGRLGGEEFGILFPETSIAAARATADRLRSIAAMVETRAENSLEMIRFTVSMGVAQAATGIESPEDLMRLADNALYRAKNSGRNRVVCASE